MRYSYFILAVATNKAVGNAVAALVAVEPGDSSAFDVGIPCYPSGTVFSTAVDGPISVRVPSNQPIAWCVPTSCTQSVYEVAAEFAGDGPYPLLNARGMTDAQVAAAKAHVAVFAGPRSTTEPNWRTHIESLGYVLP